MNRLTAKAVIDWFASIAMIGVALIILLERGPWRETTDAGGVSPSSASESIPTDPIAMRASTSIGSRQAAVATILFVDFQCPYSRRFAEDVWPSFYKTYVEPGKVLFALHHLPLPIHRDAFEAAVGAECAGQQGRLLAMQEVLFKAPRDHFSAEGVRKLGHSLAMDTQKFDDCLVGSGRATVDIDVDAAAEWGVRGTPTIFFGKLDGSQRASIDVRLAGLPTLSRLARILERRYGL